MTVFSYAYGRCSNHSLGISMNVCMQAKISLFRFNLSTSKQVLLIYQSAVLTLTSVHAYMSLSMAVSESRALRKLSKKIHWTERETSGPSHRGLPSFSWVPGLYLTGKPGHADFRITPSALRSRKLLNPQALGHDLQVEI
jgi:hypothetical protein